MEMQYCDRCGNVIQGAELTGASLGGKFQCSTCRDDQQPEPSGHEASLSKAMKDGNMSFFSSETIAKRRADRKETRLKLVDEPDHAEETEQSQSRAPDPAKAPKPTAGPSATNVNLLSTLAQKGDGSTFWVKGDALPKSVQGSELTRKTSNKSSSTATVSQHDSVERWKIRCLHCEAKLGIKPVAERSKMRCPRCQGQLIIDPDQNVNAIREAPGATAQKATTSVETGERPSSAMVSDLADFLRSPNTATPPAGVVDGGFGSAGATPEQLPMAASTETSGGSTATAVATIDEVPEMLRTPKPMLSPSVGSSEMNFLDKGVDAVDGNVHALLGHSNEPTPTVHQLAVPAEKVMLGLLCAALPAFVGIGIIHLMDNPEFVKVLGVYGDVIQANLDKMTWLGR